MYIYIHIYLYMYMFWICLINLAVSHDCGFKAGRISEPLEYNITERSIYFLYPCTSTIKIYLSMSKSLNVGKPIESIIPNFTNSIGIEILQIWVVYDIALLGISIIMIDHQWLIIINPYISLLILNHYTMKSSILSRFTPKSWRLSQHHCLASFKKPTVCNVQVW